MKELKIIFSLFLVISAVFFLNKNDNYSFNSFLEKITNDEEFHRVNKIVKNHSEKIFGLDISHYQKKEHIDWANLTIENENIPLEFVVMRATMGNDRVDKHFQYFWEKAKEQRLICGAYHYYGPNEDPVLQANSYLQQVKLGEGDLFPVLDVEKLPKLKTLEQFRSEVKTWLEIVEKAYGKKPILYTYSNFYIDYLKGHFEEYPLWIADYRYVVSPVNVENWVLWQFSSRGTVKGIATKVDLNVFNGGRDELNKIRFESENVEKNK